MKIHKILEVLSVIVVSIFSTAFGLGYSTGVHRKLTSYLNPDCPAEYCNSTDEPTITLIHITADSGKDMLHYIWDFTGIPAVMIALTSRDAKLSIDWNKFQMGSAESIKFSENPSYVTSAVIKKIYEFDDVNGTGVLEPNRTKDIISYDTIKYKWLRTGFIHDEDYVEVIVSGSHDKHNGTFILKFSCFSSKDHGKILPHLLHTSNTTQIDFMMQNISYSNFKSPGFAMELLLVSTENKLGKYALNRKKNMDDEYTPGIFDVVEILSPYSSQNSSGAFFQYRPISFKNKIRDSADSSITSQEDPNNIKDPSHDFMLTLPWTYFGHNIRDLLAQQMNISLGVDGRSFAALLGYGIPASDGFSPFVIVVAFVGILVPLSVLFIGGVYVGIKRRSQQSDMTALVS